MLPMIKMCIIYKQRDIVYAGFWILLIVNEC